MAEEKAEDMNAATLFSGFHDGFMAEEKAEGLCVISPSRQSAYHPDVSNAATFLSGVDNGLILQNAGEYLSFFEVSQFLITCKDWRLVFKGTEAPIKEFWKCLGRKVLRSLVVANPQWTWWRSTYIWNTLTHIGCDCLQDIRIYQLYLKLHSDPEIMEGCHVMLTETNGAKSIKIVTKTNFNDHVRDRALNNCNNALKRRKLD